jgi:uncharacterized protein
VVWPKSFEWDERKARRNESKHHVTFPMAAAVFKDPVRLEQLDESENYGEERWNTIGMASGLYLFVTYAERGDVCRIISARPATKAEVRHYHDRS